jgi:hypothetical protein
MGATDIALTIPKRATNKEVHAALNAARAENAACNGHQDGYSGDWQTIYRISFIPGRVFNTRREAEDFAWNKCEKGEAFVMNFHPVTKSGRRSTKVHTIVVGLAAC